MQIAANLKDTLGIIRTAEQCSTRYKTIMKRKKTAVAHNNKSGNSPTPVPFEDEVEKIRWLDDSLEPAELRDSHGIVSKKARHNPLSTTASLSSQGDTNGSAEGSTSTLDDLQPCTLQHPTDSVENRTSVKTVRASTARAQEVKLFFEEMEHLQNLKEEKKAAREEQRRLHHEQKKEYREQLKKERAERHEQKMALFKRAFGLTDDE